MTSHKVLLVAGTQQEGVHETRLDQLTQLDVAECALTSHEVLLVAGTQQEGVHETRFDQLTQLDVVIQLGRLRYGADLAQRRLVDDRGGRHETTGALDSIVYTCSS